MCACVHARAGRSPGVPVCGHLLDLGSDASGQGLHFLGLLHAPRAPPQAFPQLPSVDFSQALPSLEQFAKKWGTDQVLGRAGGSVSLVSELAVGR